jgi:Tol biopolymer transport system component
MAPSRKTFFFIVGIALILCCLMGTGGLILTFRSRVNPPTVPILVFPTRFPVTLSPAAGATASTPIPIMGPVPQGKIVYVCQIFRLQARDQICLINADGTGERRLTTDDTARHYYPSFAPDGQSVLFSSNIDGNFKIYELTLTGQLTSIGGVVGVSPEVSPDNQFIAFATSDGKTNFIWVMDRDGSHQRLFRSDGWDPTWSSDGSRILFATTIDDKPQLASMNMDGSDFRQITNLPDLRGRSDWSADGTHIVTYSGKAWQRELFMMNADGSDLHQITSPGGNSQGPSFSPDGQWVAFTAYFDAPGNNNGCEIYIMQVDGSRLMRLTNNKYCDWQPRWGP